MAAALASRSGLILRSCCAGIKTVGTFSWRLACSGCSTNGRQRCKGNAEYDASDGSRFNGLHSPFFHFSLFLSCSGCSFARERKRWRRSTAHSSTQVPTAAQPLSHLACHLGPLTPTLSLSHLQRLLNQWKAKVAAEYDASKVAMRECVKAGCVAGELRLLRTLCLVSEVHV